MTPHTVEFNVQTEDGQHRGSLVTWALPHHGDLVRVDEPGNQPIYEVVRSYFEPENITVIVRPVDGQMPTVESEPSPFYSQSPRAGGFS